MSAGPWITKYYCINCSDELTEHEVYYNLARCPRCGHKAQGAVSIVRCKEKAARWIHTAPWWRFWGEQGHWEIK